MKKLYAYYGIMHFSLLLVSPKLRATRTIPYSHFTKEWPEVCWRDKIMNKNRKTESLQVNINANMLLTQVHHDWSNNFRPSN